MFERISRGEARRYDDYARSGVRYRVGVEQILRVAGDLSCLRVADVACGTGLLTEALLERVGLAGRVVAIDHADEMLRMARARTRDSRVTFVRASAEQLADVAEGPVDVICCNAAFWLFDRDRVLAEFSRALTPNGYVIFNLSDRALPGSAPAPSGFGARPVFRRRAVLERCLARARARYPERDFPPRERTRAASRTELRAQLERVGLALAAGELACFAIPRDDELAWLQIDAWRGHPLGALTWSERRDVIGEVFAEIPPDAVFPARWLTLRADRVPST